MLACYVLIFVGPAEIFFRIEVDLCVYYVGVLQRSRCYVGDSGIGGKVIQEILGFVVILEV